MASVLYTVPLASTPPVSTPRASSSSGGRPRSAIVSFSRGSTAEEVGSWKGSFTEGAAAGFSRSLGRSLGRTPEGGSFLQRGSLQQQQPPAAAPKPPAAPRRQQSIPKSASFVRQEGFAARPDSPLNTPPASPQPRSLNGLLSRQLSSDGTLPLGAGGFTFDLAGAAAASGGLLGGDPLAASIDRLEQSLRLSGPSQQARGPRPGDVAPAELLKQLQSQYDVFSEAEVVRAFNIAHAAHDGRYRESGEPAFMHCVEVARSLAVRFAAGRCWAQAGTGLWGDKKKKKFRAVQARG